MKATNNNTEIRFEIDEDCIDVYIDDKHAGDFTIVNEYGTIIVTPSSIDLENIKESRKGHYTFIISSILNGDLNTEIESLFDDVSNIIFRSVLRTEKACNFWNKLGYSNEYNEEEHENGNQEVIEISL